MVFEKCFSLCCFILEFLLFEFSFVCEMFFFVEIVVFVVEYLEVEELDFVECLGVGEDDFLVDKNVFVFVVFVVLLSIEDCVFFDFNFEGLFFVVFNFEGFVLVVLYFEGFVEVDG